MIFWGGEGRGARVRDYDLPRNGQKKFVTKLVVAWRRGLLDIKICMPARQDGLWSPKGVAESPEGDSVVRLPGGLLFYEEK